MSRYITRNIMKDGIDRRGFLECMSWAGTGTLWSVTGGVGASSLLGAQKRSNAGSLNFVQISDSHLGFSKDANKDVAATLTEVVAKINALPEPPAFLIHTGDISHLSKPAEFDAADQILKTVKTGQTFFVPGEHDVLGTNGKDYLERYGKQSRGSGWYSFDRKGVHFIGLVNVMDLKAGGLGSLGNEQIEWLEKDLKGRSNSTPIVVFAHVPLWTVYPEWGWGTDDGMKALGYLKRFGSVTVLNGHIHQTMQKVEGNMQFHTACSTAFPQPAPGSAPAPGPMKVPTEQLRSYLGLTSIKYTQGEHALAIVDSKLDEKSSASGAASLHEVKIQNFAFGPASVSAAVGARVTWINQDDMPHNVVSLDKAFASPVLDTDDKFAHEFTQAGEYKYFCSLHPKMTGTVVVTG